MSTATEQPRYIVCYPNEKRPIGNNWAERPLTWSEVLRRLANNPNINIGVLLGEASGLIDVECDSPEAEHNLRELIGDELLDSAPCWQSKRGKHWLFKYDPRLAVLLGVVKFKGVEFRLGNGKAVQSIIPPSVVDGVQRTWLRSIDECESPELPDHVIELLLETGQSGSDTDHTPDDFLGDLGLQDAAVEKWTSLFKRRGIAVDVSRRDKLGRVWLRLRHCPFKDGDHDSDGDPALIVNADGSCGWACRHANCASKRAADVEAILGDEPVEKRVIKIGTDLDKNVRDTIAALAKCPNVFQRAGLLVQVVEAPPKPKLCLHDNGGPRLVPIAPAMLPVLLTTCATFEKFDARSEKWKQCLPPASIVAAVHATTDYPGVPNAEGIVSTPTLRADGSVLNAPGYDSATGLYADINGEYPALMTREDALATLLDIVVDFPFLSPAHRSGWLASLITPLVRHAYTGSTPFFLFDANASGSGKGLLTDANAMIIEGRSASRYSGEGSNEEVRKAITSAVLGGVATILFDNLKNKFGGGAIENAITTGRWSDRLLGGNSFVDFVIYLVWLGTSNNCTLTTDMIRRTLHIRLESKDERPELRTGFKHPNLLDYVREHRRRLAIAALSIPAAYIAAGRPDQRLPAWGGFEAWSDLVRGSIVWAGLPDPGETRTMLREQADDDTDLLRRLIVAWQELGFPATVGAAFEALDNAGPDSYRTLREVLAELSGPRHDALGKMLRKYRGRIVDGQCFDRVEGRHSKWYVRAAQ